MSLGTFKSHLPPLPQNSPIKRWHLCSSSLPLSSPGLIIPFPQFFLGWDFHFPLHSGHPPHATPKFPMYLLVCHLKMWSEQLGGLSASTLTLRLFYCHVKMPRLACWGHVIDTILDLLPQISGHMTQAAWVSPVKTSLTCWCPESWATKMAALSH